MRSMHIVTRKALSQPGLTQCVAIGRRLPLFWLPALIGSIPGVAWAGRSSYNKFAATRPRDVPCTDDVCGLPSRTSLGSPRDSRPMFIIIIM